MTCLDVGPSIISNFDNRNNFIKDIISVSLTNRFVWMLVKPVVDGIFVSLSLLNVWSGIPEFSFGNVLEFLSLKIVIINEQSLLTYVDMKFFLFNNDK